MKNQNEKEWLVPVIDFSKCVKCEECIAACPHHVIKRENLLSCSKCIKYCVFMDVPCKSNDYFFEYELCDSCGKCVEACKHGAIKMEKFQIRNNSI
jgi:Pyruvate/2-oxoacid:ferredoxin oxidoreductase delta subunit